MPRAPAAPLRVDDSAPLERAREARWFVDPHAAPHHPQGFHTARRHSGNADTLLVRRCEQALALLLSQRGDLAAAIERILADHPHSIFAHCLRAARIVRDDDRTARSALAASLAAIETVGLPPGDPARRHAAAASAWLQNDPALALHRYGAITAATPRDALALATAHALDFRLGRRSMLRDRIAAAMPAWDAGAPGYPSILAMYAFGLEENGEYRRAESLARDALRLDPGHPPAIHVVVHVMEMEGRADEGLAFLAATEAAWIDGTGLSVHLAWHRALFHLSSNDPASALAVYDARIARAPPPSISALADASALLWRMRLKDFELSERWQRLADRWDSVELSGVRTFYIVHAMMAFAAAGRAAAAAQLLDALPRIDTSDTAQPLPEEALARPVCAAFLAFVAGDDAACIESLERVRSIVDRCGGSLAQCELVQLTLTAAMVRARRSYPRH